MVEFKTGNILAEDADALVNTVNCVGVMGRGIALQFKNAFLITSRPTRRPANIEKFSRDACSFSRSNA